MDPPLHDAADRAQLQPPLLQLDGAPVPPALLLRPGRGAGRAQPALHVQQAIQLHFPAGARQTPASAEQVPVAED